MVWTADHPALTSTDVVSPTELRALTIHPPPPPPQVVEVDLLAERFSEGKPSRERLQWCITDRLALEMDFVLCCNSSDGNAVTGVSSNPFIATVRRGPVLQLHGCREASLSESHQSAGGTRASSTPPL